MDNSSEYKLCYVHDNWAYFTTQKIENQWGDDWDDAPYEHNAEEPYEWNKNTDGNSCVCLDKKMGYKTYGPNGCGEKNHKSHGPKEKWTILKVAFDAPYITPSFEHLNSPYSVEMINRGDIAWLRPTFDDRKETKPIHAGTTLKNFIKLVKESGGKVYLEA